MTAARLMLIAIEPTTELPDLFYLLHALAQLKDNYGADTFTTMHQVKGTIDIFQWHGVCHH